jgi:hypothetical protein
MPSRSNKPDGDSEPILDLIERVGDEATKFTLEEIASVKTPEAEKKELDRIASEIAMDLNADPNDEEVQRLAVFQAAARRLTKGTHERA